MLASLARRSLGRAAVDHAQISERANDEPSDCQVAGTHLVRFLFMFLYEEGIAEALLSDEKYHTPNRRGGVE